MITNYIPFDINDTRNYGLDITKRDHTNVIYLDNLLGFSPDQSKAITQIPNYVDFQSEMGFCQNQGHIGTCYMEATVAWCIWFYWKHTGKYFSLTRHEIWDICGDYQNCSYDTRKKAGENETAVDNIIGGGWDSVTDVVNFNSKLDLHYWSNKKENKNLDELKSLYQKMNTSGKFKCTKYAYESFPGVDNIKKILFLNGPCLCAFGTSGGGHEVVLIGYDSSNFYFRNSWGDTTPYSLTHAYLKTNFWALHWYGSQNENFE